VLKSYNVPATAGVLQSSTYRSGYGAGQANDPAVAAFLRWAGEGGRQLADIEGLFGGLARAFADLELVYGDLPPLDPDAFNFVTMRSLVEHLRARGSGGAYEQYLVAALLHEEFALVHPGWRVETKPVGATDASARSVGDVQVRNRMTLVHAFEVSAQPWRNKVGQAAQAGGLTGSRQVTVVAPAPGLSSAQLGAALEAAGVPAGVDVAVVDLDGFLDSVSARLTPVARAAAVRQLYEHLRTWGRARPDLVLHLVEALTALRLTAPGPAEASAGGISEPLARLSSLSAQRNGDVVVEVARDDLDAVLVWVQARLGE
jgi:hypothetical protein